MVAFEYGEQEQVMPRVVVKDARGGGSAAAAAWASHKCSPIVFPLSTLCGHHCRPLQRQWVGQCSPSRSHESSSSEWWQWLQHRACLHQSAQASRGHDGNTRNTIHAAKLATDTQIRGVIVTRAAKLLPTNTATGKLRSRLADIYTHGADSTSHCSRRSDKSTLYLFSVR
jgi:hypothetical protein